MIPTYKNFTECYYDLIKQVYTNPQYVCSPRGQPIRENIGVSFKITDPRNRLPYIPERNYSIGYMLGELLWVMDGRNDVDWISTYSPFWLNVTDDGSTSSSAPGYRIFKKHPRIDNGSHVQYDRILQELKNDRDSRRAILYFTQPTDHFASKLDIGCVTNSQLMIRNDRLHQIVNMRSSDLILGLPYDFGIFTVLQELIALDLGVELGEVIWHSNSEHIYERNFEVAEAVVNAPLQTDCPAMPKIVTSPPVRQMVVFEDACRKAETEQDLRELYKNIGHYVMDSYWQDWCRVYVGHKAKKVSKDLKREIYANFEFEGFRRFKK